MLAHETTTLPLAAFLAPRRPDGTLSLTLDHVGLLVIADVIIARDVMSGEELTVYGSDDLERVNSGKALSGQQLLKIDLDIDSDELSDLLKVVAAIKGWTHLDDDEEEFEWLEESEGADNGCQ